MEKKLTIGISVFAVLNFAVGAICSFVIAFFLFDNSAVFIAGCLMYLILSFGLFKLQDWARIILLLTVIPVTFLVSFNIINFYIVYPGLPNYHAVVTRIMVKNSLYTLPFITYCEGVLYFFTRSEVRAAFSGSKK